jgi:ribonuclease BN (tRNA processing enzyme)
MSWRNQAWKIERVGNGRAHLHMQRHHARPDWQRIIFLIPASVTDVVLTHIHMDHVGGPLPDGLRGRLRPDLRVHLAAAEAEFWASSGLSAAKGPSASFRAEHTADHERRRQNFAGILAKLKEASRAWLRGIRIDLRDAAARRGIFSEGQGA